MLMARPYATTLPLLYATLLTSGCIISTPVTYDYDDSCDAVAHSDCEWDEFCYDGECQGALGRRYEVIASWAEVGTTTPEGFDWDAFGGAPDLYADFGLANDIVSTSVVSDSFGATWDEFSFFVLDSGSSFEFYVWDDDLADDDLVAGWYWEGDDALVELVRDWGLQLNYSPLDDSRIVVSFMIVPDF